VTLAAIAGSFLLAWSAGAHAQTGDEESPFRAPRPEPKEGLLTPTEPTPPGGVPLLKRFVPGLADGLKAQTPFIRDTSLNLHLRSFYFNRLNGDESQNEAWAFGGWLAYKSGWLLDTARVGAVGYSIACVDCHEPTTMAVRVTRPGFIAGIKALKARQGIAGYDPNRDATRQEMRSFVCGQCHVEYYFKGARQGRDVSVGERAQGRGDRGVLRARDREEGRGGRGRAARRGRAAPQGAVAARLRGRRELDGVPRAAGAGADSRRGDRPRAAGPARGRAGHPQEVGMSDARSVTVYRAADAPPGALAGDTVAVLGYGNLGRTAALNLRDSGVKTVVGNREDEYAVRARAEGFEVLPLRAAAAADVVFLLLPDEVIPEAFPADVAPALRPGSAIAFGSGYSLAFGLVSPPDTVDVLLVAPRMAGAAARARYLSGEGFWACVGVEADRSGRARRRMLGLAEALGALRAGAVEMRAAEEATLDLFVEQTVGPLLGAAIMAAFEVGREAGLPPEVLVLEMYMSGEMETVFRGFRESGFFRASEEHGPTAVFGGMIRTLELDGEAMTARFRAVLEEIRNGAFAGRFQAEAREGYPMLGVARAMMHGPSAITEAEDRLRGLARA